MDGGGWSQFAGPAGFMPSPAPGGGDYNSYGMGNKKGSSGARSNVPESVRSVTIAQLLGETQQSDDDNYMLDGQAISNVLIVACIQDVQNTNTNYIYTMHDTTGTLEVLSYVSDEPHAAQKQQALRGGVWVRAFGTLRRIPNSGQLGLNAYSVTPIDDYNETTFHHLQAIFQRMQLQKSSVGPQGMQGSGPTMMYGAGGAPPGYAAPATGQMGAHPRAPGMYGGAQQQGTGDVQEDVLAVYRAPEGQGPSGLHNDQVYSMLCARGLQYSKDAVLQTISTLSANGHIYTTTDDSWNKLCE